jgi:ribosomal protein S18 acetylase RimI-like enzyme
MFCPPSLAARIDRAEARLCAGIADHFRHNVPDQQSFVMPFSGGLAVYAAQDSPTNKVIGAGFDGPVEESAVARIENEFAKRAARLQMEISTLADTSLHSSLAARGFVANGFENVLGHPLSHVEPAVEGVKVQPAVEHELSTFADVLVNAFASPDIGGVGGDEIPPSDEIRKWVLITMSLPGFRGYLARIGEQIAGAASLRFDTGVAQFSGAGTLPQFRRRGVQTALLRARLRDAAHSGCDVGVVVTQPASRSQQNAQREGFSLLYARQLWVKDFSAQKRPSENQ